MPVPSRTPARGFTIIETMLALAAAGLIALIVFQAIPVLTRNSRNAQRKQDVSAILQAVSNYQLNNSGAFVGPCGITAAPRCDATATTPPRFLSVAGPKLSSYDPAEVSAPVTGRTDPFAVAGETSVEKVKVLHYHKCRDDGQAIRDGAGFRDIVALYAVETGAGGPTGTRQCQEL